MQNYNAKFKSLSAFTLIEVILAVSILAFGLIGVVKAYIVSVDALEVSQYIIDTTYLLNEKLAEIEQEIIEEPQYFLDNSEGKFEGGYRNFKWVVTVSDSVNEDLKEVKITVFSEQIQPGREESLVCYVENK